LSSTGKLAQISGFCTNSIQSSPKIAVGSIMANPGNVKTLTGFPLAEFKGQFLSKNTSKKIEIFP